ncbi:hypothetical protein KI617_06300 [Ferribacterium limneticum]|nr:hypothetical protein KI617_06300 [Ferribacterium limneticum]UCV33614.1 hypothetical protein KI608_06300 [Ferribacterium limneticum]
MDGQEAVRRIRRMAHYASTPIVALTANAFDEDRPARHPRQAGTAA